MRLKDVKDSLKQTMKDNLDEAKHHQYPNSVFYTSENDGLKKALDKLEEYEKSKQTITNIEYNIHDVRGGCDTCDYGSRYIRDMYIEYDKKIKVHFHTNLKVDMNISESEWMMAVLNNDELDDLLEWYKSKVVNFIKEDYMWKDYRQTTGPDIYYEIENLELEDSEPIRHYIGVDD